MRITRTVNVTVEFTAGELERLALNNLPKRYEGKEFALGWDSDHRLTLELLPEAES